MENGDCDDCLLRIELYVITDDKHAAVGAMVTPRRGPPRTDRGVAVQRLVKSISKQKAMLVFGIDWRRAAAVY